MPPPSRAPIARGEVLRRFLHNPHHPLASSPSLQHQHHKPSLHSAVVLPLPTTINTHLDVSSLSPPRQPHLSHPNPQISPSLPHSPNFLLRGFPRKSLFPHQIQLPLPSTFCGKRLQFNLQKNHGHSGHAPGKFMIWAGIVLLNNVGRRRRRGFEHNVSIEGTGSSSMESRRRCFGTGSRDQCEEMGFLHVGNGNYLNSFPVEGQAVRSSQLEVPGSPAGITVQSVSATSIEESLLNSHAQVVDSGGSLRQGTEDTHGDNGRVCGRFEDASSNSSGLHDKDVRSNTRGQRYLKGRTRYLRRIMECRGDIWRLNAPFLAIYESLLPAEEEKAKQKVLLTSLQRLVHKEWPNSKLHLYGSCANSFAVSKSDIDVCLVLEDRKIDKSKVLLKLAELLELDNFQDVQVLTEARVPIVKLKDPVTGIPCDICINHSLAVHHTKLLQAYSEIDVRLRQLVFIVKHWAKCRGVSDPSKGTLSSFAYVLMCIHFLQQRKPAILPCLQEMPTTYAATVDGVQFAYCDQAEELGDFGSHNREGIAELVWGLFKYWAYCHNYGDSVISVRTGSILSKKMKCWTRRIGNEMRLICIEDPVDKTRDLGRGVDEHGIQVIREEFERAADVMQFDPNPCATLFQPCGVEEDG